MTLHVWHTTYGRIAAWLGLLAILLLFIAPVISTSRAAASSPHDMPMSEHVMGDHHAITMLDSAEANFARSGMMHHGAMMDDAACGYCVLLAHLPMLMAALPLLWQQSLPSRAPPPHSTSRPLCCRPCTYYHPRAPPRPLHAH